MTTAASSRPPLPEALLASLERGRELGFLGDGPVESHVRHATGFADVATAAGVDGGATSFLDLGTGAGVPGLVLVAIWPESSAILLDASERRCASLRQAVEECGWESRVRVVQARAEAAGRDESVRGTQQLIVARSFGPPAVLAECAAPLLIPGGLLIVSEPPLSSAGVEQGESGVSSSGPVRPSAPVGHPDRWPEDGLLQFGLALAGFYERTSGYQVLRQVTLCPERFPRRDGVPQKRPLY